MNFNEYVESRTPLMRSLGELFNLNCGENHAKLKDIHIHQPEFDYSECLVRQVPYCYKVDIIVEFDEGPNKGKQFKYVLEIPKMCEHGFLIADPTGDRVKFRSPIVIGELNQKLLFRGNATKKNRKIHMYPFIDLYLDSYDYGKGGVPCLVVTLPQNEKNPIVKFPLVGFLLHFGIPEEEVAKYFNTKDVPELESGEYALISVPEDQIEYYNNKILQITKKDPKLTKEDPYLKAEFIFELIKVGFDAPLTYEPYTPFDISFMDFSKLLFDIDIKRQKFIKSKIARLIQKGSDVGASLTKNVYASFSMQSDSGSVQVASNSNALSFLSQSNKIYFKNYKKNNKKQMIYTSDFYGVVCPSKTPESVSLTSAKNEVASDVSFDENQNVLVSVYTKEFLHTDKELTPIKIKYSDYYRSRILSLDNLDYRIRKIIPIDGKIKILHLGEFKEIPFKSEDDFDYIRASPEGALAFNTGLIPMANKCDGTRMSMATGMLDQAIPVIGARKSIVKTSMNKLIFDKSNFNIKASFWGTVVRVVDNYITFDLGNGKFKTVATPDALSTSAHTCNRFMPAVTIGDEVKKGDVIFISDSFKGNELALTVPLRVGYYAYGTSTEEDAIVISESASKLLGHSITKVVKITIPSKKVALFDKQQVIKKLTDIGRIDSYNKKIAKLNEFGLPIPGVEYSRMDRDALSIYQSYSYDPNNPSGKIMDILRTSSKKDALKLYRVDREDLPQEFSEGVVNRVRVFYKNTEEVRNRYAKLIEYYNKDHEEYLDNIKGGINTNVPEYNIPMPNKGENDLVILITITSTINAEMGSKITNRYASKGTISDVLPDDQMPRINDESGLPLQILIPPQSTINRKNIAQIFEMNLCLLCKMAYDKNEENIKLKNFNSVRESLNKLYVTDKFNNYSDENLTEFHKSFDEYYSIEVNSIDKTYTQRVMSELCEYFGIDQDGVYLYDPVESERITIQKVTVGITEIMRLHFIPQFKAKATSDILDSENTVLYGGSTRSGGQKIGEMESWQVHVHGIENPINNIVKNASGISLDDYTNIALLNQARVAGLEYCLYQQLIKD